MLSGARGLPFVKLPNEIVYYTSPPRIAFSLKKVRRPDAGGARGAAGAAGANTVDDDREDFSTQCASGSVFLTNIRVSRNPAGRSRGTPLLSQR